MISRISFMWCALIFIFSNSVLANNDLAREPLYTIKLYFEPDVNKKTLRYQVILPRGIFYSYYLGSDLPTWRVVKKNVITNQFHPGDLVNVRIHADATNHAQKVGPVSLNVTDVSSNHIIWQGKIYYDVTHEKISVIPTVFNQKEFTTHLKIERSTHTLWVESATRATDKPFPIVTPSKEM